MAQRVSMFFIVTMLAMPLIARTQTASHPDLFEMKSHEVRSLSDDGRTMTVRATADTPRGKQTMTVTYAKLDE
jgi:hypothetical protein